MGKHGCYGNRQSRRLGLHGHVSQLNLQTELLTALFYLSFRRQSCLDRRSSTPRRRRAWRCIDVLRWQGGGSDVNARRAYIQPIVVLINGSWTCAPSRYFAHDNMFVETYTVHSTQPKIVTISSLSSLWRITTTYWSLLNNIDNLFMCVYIYIYIYIGLYI